MADDDKYILFEHPLNERCRTLLRLSRLFNQFEKHLANENPWSSITAIRALLDISSVLARADIKSELIKELERHGKALSEMTDNPEVDLVRLEQILEEISLLSTLLRKDNAQLGKSLRKNEFLTSLSQRLVIPGGSFDFDLPQFHYWLHLPHSERAMQLDGWRDEVAHVQGTVDLLLTLIRNSTNAEDAIAKNGFYEHSLSTKKIAQMVQVSVNTNAHAYAEISGSKHRFCVRFMETGDWARREKSTRDIPFRLRVCVL